MNWRKPAAKREKKKKKKHPSNYQKKKIKISYYWIVEYKSNRKPGLM